MKPPLKMLGGRPSSGQTLNLADCSGSYARSYAFDRLGRSICPVGGGNCLPTLLSPNPLGLETQLVGGGRFDETVDFRFCDADTALSDSNRTNFFGSNEAPEVRPPDRKAFARLSNGE